MSQFDTPPGGSPPGGSPPRVHHPGPPAQQGPTGPGATTGEINPEDYNNPAVADYMDTKLPAGIVYVNGQPEAAPTGKPPAPLPVLSDDQAARQAADAAYEGLTTKRQSFWPAVGRLISLGFLRDGVDPRGVRVNLPFNAGQVRAGSMAVIKAVQTDKKAESMEVDLRALGEDLALALRIAVIRETLDPIHRVADANETIVLQRLADRVGKALKLGASVIAADGNLTWVLGPALAIRDKPTQAAAATRADNARTEEAIRADEQQKMQVGIPQQGPPQTTTTITTQGAPGASTGAQGAKAPLSSHKPPKK